MMGFLIALISGILMSVQGVFNTNMTKASGIWSAAIFVQLSALITCVVMWLFDKHENVLKVLQVQPKISLLGGVIGAFITFTVIKCITELGVAKAELIIVISQVAFSYIMELTGLFGADKTTFSWQKLVGIAIAASGMFLFSIGGK